MRQAVHWRHLTQFFRPVLRYHERALRGKGQDAANGFSPRPRLGGLRLMARVVRVCVVVTLLSAAIVGASGDPPLTTAVKSRDVAAVRALIASRADVNATAGDGSTPLLWAAYNSDVEAARLLIRAGAKADVANRYGITPLLHASRIGDEAMIKALLDGGANPALTHPDGETTLMGAARSGSVAAVRLLLDRIADPARPPVTKRLPTTFMHRHSCGCP